MIKVILCALLLCLSHFSWGDSEPSEAAYENFKSLALAMPNFLTQHQIFNFGDVDLRQLESCLPSREQVIMKNEINVKVLDFSTLKLSRSWAEWSGGQLKLERGIWTNNDNQELKSIVACHDVLNICGWKTQSYSDTSYPWSLAMWSAVRILKKGNVQDPGVRQLLNQLMARRGGGVYGNGGGGDGGDVIYPTKLLSVYIDTFLNSPNQRSQMEERILSVLHTHYEVSHQSDQRDSDFIETDPQTLADINYIKNCKSLVKMTKAEYKEFYPMMHEKFGDVHDYIAKCKRVVKASAAP